MAVNVGRTVFAQLISRLSRIDFRKCVAAATVIASYKDCLSDPLRHLVADAPWDDEVCWAGLWTRAPL